MTSNAGSSRSKTALPISNKVILPAIGKANNKPTTSPGSNAGGAKVGSWAAGDESSAGITAYGGGGDRQQEEGGRDDDEEVRRKKKDESGALPPVKDILTGLALSILGLYITLYIVASFAIGMTG